MKPVRLKDLHIPHEVLQPMKTNTELDAFVSVRGGFLPSTVYIVVGGAGTGKTSWAIDTLSKLQSNNPTKKCLYISGEQDEIDNYELSTFIPGLLELDTIYLAGVKNPQKLIEETLDQGWDMVMMDSLEVVSGRIETTTDLNSRQSLKWVMDLMFKHKRGNNPTNTYTGFLVIQQATKSGVFKGDSSIEFDTTGMLYIRKGQGSERHLEFSKNRRGESNTKLFYKLDDGQMVYMKEEEEIVESPVKPTIGIPTIAFASIIKALAKKRFKTNLTQNESFVIVKELENTYQELVKQC
jgi:predicted ATP-dependent serine protease